MARRRWTIIPNDWIQLERIINQLGYNILDVPASLSGIISDISTAKSDLILKLESDNTYLSDSIVGIAGDVSGVSDALLSDEVVHSDAIYKNKSDIIILSDFIIAIDGGVSNSF